MLVQSLASLITIGMVFARGHQHPRRVTSPAPSSKLRPRMSFPLSLAPFFSSPFGGNNAWRPHEPQTQPEEAAGHTERSDDQ